MGLKMTEWDRKLILARTIDEAKLALDNGADANVRTECGHTALMLAQYWQLKDIEELLIERGARS